MNLITCGGRDFTDYEMFEHAMSRLPFIPAIIIEGDALGADRLGRKWAISNGIHYATVPALWTVFNNAAGPKRNGAMTLLNPHYCIAMPGGTGTADMIKQCKRFNITYWQPYG